MERALLNLEVVAEAHTRPLPPAHQRLRSAPHCPASYVRLCLCLAAQRRVSLSCSAHTFVIKLPALL